MPPSNSCMHGCVVSMLKPKRQKNTICVRNHILMLVIANECYHWATKTHTNLNIRIRIHKPCCAVSVSISHTHIHECHKQKSHSRWTSTTSYLLLCICLCVCMCLWKISAGYLDTFFSSKNCCYLFRSICLVSFEPAIGERRICT